jgi:plastocyanin
VLFKIAEFLIIRCGCLIWAASCFGANAAAGQQDPVTALVHVGSRPQGKATVAVARGDGEVVVWLKPLDRAGSTSETQPKRHKLIQSHKIFEPHILIVQIGSVVEFPNHDPFFHNVFSLFEGKRFDLGLYEAGATNSVRFDRPGVSFLFCNIHPEMSAVVVSVDTPYYGKSDTSGKVTIANVPDGKYELHYWSERGLPDSLRELTRTVIISSSTRSLAPVQIAENPDFTAVHKNKYGQDYAPPPNVDYSRP